MICGTARVLEEAEGCVEEDEWEEVLEEAEGCVEEQWEEEEG